MFTLRHFGLFIGYANILGGIFAAIACIFMYVKHNEIVAHQHVDNAFLCGLIAFLFSICLVSAGVSSMLVSGIHKKRHCLMRPWIVFTSISVIVSCISTIAKSAADQQPIDIIIALLSLAVESCIIYAINTLYYNVKAQATQSEGNSDLVRRV